MTLNPFSVSRWHRCTPFVLAGLLWFVSSAHGVLHPWEKVEVVLTAAKNYPNPYVDVEVWVELSGPGFTKRCYGFWDGGRTYRVRVVATAPGQGDWRSGSNQDDPGLSGNPAVRARTGMAEVVGWVYERPGGGRGFGFTGMHTHWNWAQDSFRKAVLNALVWIAGAEVPPGGVPSKTPTLEELESYLGQPRPANFNVEAMKKQIEKMNP